jgi:hypothetical protein
MSKTRPCLHSHKFSSPDRTQDGSPEGCAASKLAVYRVVLDDGELAQQTALGLSSFAVTERYRFSILNLELAAVSLRFIHLRTFLSQVKSCLYDPCS